MPGPTPALLVATNAAFTALQVLLLVLALATYSVHFIILSCLSAGLWWSINWFSRELQMAQQKEEEEEKERLNPKGKRRGRRETGSDGQKDDMETGSETGTETETETEIGMDKIKVRARDNKSRHDGGGRGTAKDYGSHGTGYLSSGGNATVSTSSSAEELDFAETSKHVGSASGSASKQSAVPGSQMRLRPERIEALQKRWSSSEGGELSTDSEWEKVDKSR